MAILATGLDFRIRIFTTTTNITQLSTDFSFILTIHNIDDIPRASIAPICYIEHEHHFYSLVENYDIIERVMIFVFHEKINLRSVFKNGRVKDRVVQTSELKNNDLRGIYQLWSEHDENKEQFNYTIPYSRHIADIFPSLEEIMSKNYTYGFGSGKYANSEIYMHPDVVTPLPQRKIGKELEITEEDIDFLSEHSEDEAKVKKSRTFADIRLPEPQPPEVKNIDVIKDEPTHNLSCILIPRGHGITPLCTKLAYLKDINTLLTSDELSELNTFTPKLNRYGILTGMKIWLDKRIELLLKPISELKDVLLVCDHICFPLYFRIPIIASFSPLKSTRIGVNLPSNVPIPENIYSYIVNDSIASIGTLRNDELSVNKTLLFSFNSIFDVITILKGQCFVKDEYTSSIFRPFYQHFLNLPYRPYILKSDADLRMPIWSTMCTLSEIQIDPDPLVEMSHYLDFMLLGAPDNIISFFKKE